MKNLLRIILALLLTPAYVIADENAKAKDENDDSVTHRHTDTQTHRHTDTQTHRHTDTQTHRHTDRGHQLELELGLGQELGPSFFKSFTQLSVSRDNIYKSIIFN